MSTIIFGKYKIEDWTVVQYYRGSPLTPLEYYWVRSISKNNDYSYGIKLSNPWGETGIIKPDEWILGFFDGTFHELFNLLYGNKCRRFFNDLEEGKQFVDLSLDKLIKLKAFL